ncbi:MAG: hypothetical protein GY930_11410 [bacterium]|nr:hypothetical protein [bacterium]
MRFALGLAGFEQLEDYEDLVNGITAILAFALAYYVPDFNPAPSARERINKVG